MSDLPVVHLENTKLDVGYCISMDTRDAQIEAALLRNIPRLRDYSKPRGETVCIVAFGPSLQDTWQEVRQFQHIYTCSGSHKFLLDKGVKPSEFQSWTHVECDPRAHKVRLMGEPQRGVRYLVSSVSHPELLNHLTGYDVMLWHIYDGSKLRDMPCIYPKGEVIVTGGSNVGLRSLVLARIAGFRHMHILGMDYSFPGPKAAQHAADHPHHNTTVIQTQIGSATFYTTPVMLHYAREFWHETDLLADCRFTLAGIGLLQAWAAIRPQREPTTASAGIALSLPYLIGDEYRRQNATLHETRPDYGSHGRKHASVVTKVRAAAKCDSVLDYGCGKGTLAKALDYPIWEYDPAIPGKDRPPRPADLVVCTDVLEHIEPDYLDVVLGDLARCCKKVALLVISTIPASKTLPDGRNTHLIVEGRKWWEKRIKKHFAIPKNGITTRGTDLQIVCAAKLIPTGLTYAET